MAEDLAVPHSGGNTTWKSGSLGPKITLDDQLQNMRKKVREHQEQQRLLEEKKKKRQMELASAWEQRASENKRVQKLETRCRLEDLETQNNKAASASKAFAKKACGSSAATGFEVDMGADIAATRQVTILEHTSEPTTAALPEASHLEQKSHNEAMHNISRTSTVGKGHAAQGATCPKTRHENVGKAGNHRGCLNHGRVASKPVQEEQNDPMRDLIGHKLVEAIVGNPPEIGAERLHAKLFQGPGVQDVKAGKSLDAGSTVNRNAPDEQATSATSDRHRQLARAYRLRRIQNLATQMLQCRHQVSQSAFSNGGLGIIS